MANVGSFVRLALGVIAGWLAKTGVEVEEGSVELVASAVLAVVAIVSAVLKNRKGVTE